jgi:hypothetical protein
VKSRKSQVFRGFRHLRQFHNLSYATYVGGYLEMRQRSTELRQADTSIRK